MFHPVVIGRPGASRALRLCLDSVIGLGDAWIIRPDQVVLSWRKQELGAGAEP
jgi:hypothetical protein